MYKLSNNADAVGISCQAEVFVSPKRLIEVFGDPADCDFNKVSAEWRFTGPGGPFTIYDWKETSLYDDDLPSPIELLQGPPISWHIGGKTKHAAEDFLAWVKEQIAGSGARIEKEGTDN